jgi:hypothetical protein
MSDKTVSYLFPPRDEHALFTHHCPVSTGGPLQQIGERRDSPLASLGARQLTSFGQHEGQTISIAPATGEFLRLYARA